MKPGVTRARMLPTAFLAGLLFVAGAAAATPDAAPDSEPSVTPDRVIASLDQTLAWYRQARVAMRAVGTVFAREDEQTALAVLRRAFEVARAQAAVLAAGSGPATAAPRAEAGPVAGKRAEVNAAIQTDQQEVERLRQGLRTAPAARRAAVQDDLAAATNRLELDRVRLDFLTKLEESKASSPDTEADLGRQIQTMQESVPELRSMNTSSPAATTPASGATDGNWGSVHRLIGIYHARSSLDQLGESTKALERRIGSDLQAAQGSLRPIMGQRQFRDLLERSKQLGAVVLSMREESALVHRFAGDLQGWKGAVDRDRWQVLQALGIGLIGVVIAMAAILVGGMLW